MALALPAATVEFEWRDGAAHRAVPRLSAQLLNPSALAASAAGIGSVMQAISDCSLVGIRITYQYHMTDAPANSGAIHTNIGQFVFSCDGIDQYYVLDVPSIKPSLLETSGVGVEIDTAAAPIVSLINRVNSGDWRNPFGYNIAALESAYLKMSLK